MKTEHVILQGNQMTPIELKIFSSQLREAKKSSVVLKKLDISNSNLTDESLQQIAKLAFLGNFNHTVPSKMNCLLLHSRSRQFILLGTVYFSYL